MESNKCFFFAAKDEKRVTSTNGLYVNSECLEDMCMFPKIGGTPKWMVKLRENSNKIDDLGVHLFLETPMCFFLFRFFIHGFMMYVLLPLEFFVGLLAGSRRS